LSSLYAIIFNMAISLTLTQRSATRRPTLANMHSPIAERRGNGREGNVN
jgi:hypothetical protein